MAYSDDDPVDIVFDPAKDRINRAKHGMSLGLAGVFFRNPTVVEEGRSMAYGERRLVAFGLIGVSVCCCVYVERGSTLRIISLRKANRRETARYFEIA